MPDALSHLIGHQDAVADARETLASSPMPVSPLAPRALLVVCAAVVCLPGVAAADPASTTPAATTPASTDAAPAPAGDAALSVELFREGRQALAQGHVAEACDKFRASLALRRSPGTLLNVGNCRVSSGDLTGAASAFEETLTLAQAAGDAKKTEAWSRAARAELDALAPRIPRLVVAPPSASDVRVELDGRPFQAFGVEQRINPGQHRLLATAPGKPRVEHRFELAEGRQLVLELFPTEAEAESTSVPAPEPEPAPVALDDSPSGGSELLPWSVLGVGGAVLVAGGVTAAIAANKASALSRECPEHLCEGDLSAPESARNTAVTADVLMAVGLVGVAVGATWLMWPEDDTTPSLSASCSGDGCSAALRGSFY